MHAQMHKYPRTRHIRGSRLQPGDEDLAAAPFEEIAGRHLVVEEKMDGANCGISFSSTGELQLQSRGHYLTGGPREKHFHFLKQWAEVYQGVLRDALSDRFVLYGEWLYAKHTMYYDRLPHFLMEFDVLDVDERVFLDTPTRRELLADVPLPPVAVLHEGPLERLDDLVALMGTSGFLSDHHIDTLRADVEAMGIDVERAINETDHSPTMEGLYIKVEANGIVEARYKYVRHSFYTTMQESDSHWLNRPVIPNRLAESVDLFGAI